MLYKPSSTRYNTNIYMSWYGWYMRYGNILQYFFYETPFQNIYISSAKHNLHSHQATVFKKHKDQPDKQISSDSTTSARIAKAVAQSAYTDNPNMSCEKFSSVKKESRVSIKPLRR